MAAIVNDRDLVLQGTNPRLIATTVTISATASNFIKGKNGGAIIPTDITLTALTTVFTSPTYAWEYSLSSNPSSWVSAGSSSSINLTGSTASSLLGGTTGFINYRVTASQTGFLTSVSPVFTVFFNKESDEQLTIEITRTIAIVAANADGSLVASPTADTGTVISVKRGTTNLNYAASGANTFSVSYAVTAGSVTYGSVVNSGTTSTYNDITAMTTDTATVTFTITVRDASGNAISPAFTATEAFTKNKASGASYQHWLQPEEVVVPIDNTGTVISLADARTTYNVTANGVDDSANWTFTKVDYNVTSTLTGNSLVVTAFGTGTSSMTTWSAGDASNQTNIDLIGQNGNGSTSDIYYYNNYLYFIPYNTNQDSAGIFRLDLNNTGAGWVYKAFPGGTVLRRGRCLYYSSSRGQLIIGGGYSTSTDIILYSSDSGNTWASIAGGFGEVVGFWEPGDGYLWAMASNGTTRRTNAALSSNTWSSITGWGPTGTIVNFNYIASTSKVYYTRYETSNMFALTHSGTSPTSTQLTGSTAGLMPVDTGTSTSPAIVAYNGIVYSLIKVSGTSPVRWAIYKSTNGTTYSYVSDIKQLEGSTSIWRLLNLNGTWYVVSPAIHTSGTVTIAYKSTNLIDWVTGSFTVTNPIFTHKVPTSATHPIGSVSASQLGNSLFLTTSTDSVNNNAADLIPTLYNWNSGNINYGYVEITASKVGQTSVVKTFRIVKANSSAPIVVSGVFPTAVVFPATSDGKVTSYTSAASIVINILENGVIENSNWTITYVKSSANITVSGSGTGPYTVTAVADGEDTGSITFTATRTGRQSQQLVWSYSKDKTGATGGLQYNTISGISSIVGYAALKFTTTGQVQAKRSSGENWNFIGNWYYPNSASIGSSYWIKVNKVSGDALTSGESNTTWTQLSSDYTVTLENAVSATTKKSDIRFYIANNSGGTGVTAYVTTFLEASLP